MFKLLVLLALIGTACAQPTVRRIRRSPDPHHHHHHHHGFGGSLEFGQSDEYYGGYNRYPPIEYLALPGGYGGYGGYNRYGSYGGYPNSYGGGYGSGSIDSFDLGFDLWR